MLIGTLGAIRRYPVKSLRGEPLDAASVGETGIPGDRSGALFVRAGHARAGRELGPPAPYHPTSTYVPTGACCTERNSRPDT